MHKPKQHDLGTVLLKLFPIYHQRTSFVRYLPQFETVYYAGKDRHNVRLHFVYLPLTYE